MNTNFYKEKIEHNETYLIKLKSIIRVILILKIFSFLLALIFLILAFQKDLESDFFYVISFISIIAFFIFQYKDAKYIKIYCYYTDLNEVYKDEVHFLNGNYNIFYNGDMFVDKKHEFSYDLDVYGEKSFFQRINRAKTYEGTVCLANKLNNISDSAEDILRKQDALAELVDKGSFRFNFLAICRGFNLDKNNYYGHIDNEIKSFLTSKTASLLIYLSIFSTIITLSLGILNYISFIIPSIFLVCQLIIPIILFKKMNRHAAEVGKLYKNIARYSELLKLIESEDFKTTDNLSLKRSLFGTHNSLSALKELATILKRFDQRENAYALVLLNALFLNDLFLLRTYFRWKNRYSGQIEKWINSLAEFEACISLANFIFNNPDYCLPELITKDGILIEAKDMGHPFIEKSKLVTNDFCVYRSSFSIITGANMAGKSTFLRCAGINYIMAVNGMRVCASKFHFSMFKIFSNMRNTDDLSSGISYFNAELMRIEQLIKFSNNNKHTLLILDEILKGTNSKDKLKGSIMFLKEMKKKAVTGIIATHDLELSKLENEEPNLFQNYCFEINISDSIDYAYKIQKGVSKNLNATLLLEEILYN